MPSLGRKNGHLTKSVTGSIEHLTKCGSCCTHFLPSQATLSGLTGYWSYANGTYALNNTSYGCTAIFDSWSGKGGCHGEGDAGDSDYYTEFLDGTGQIIAAWYYLDGVRIEVEQSNTIGVNEGSIKVWLWINIWSRKIRNFLGGPYDPGACTGPSKTGPYFEDDPITPCLDDSTTYLVPYVSGNMPTQTAPTGGVNVDLA